MGISIFGRSVSTERHINKEKRRKYPPIAEENIPPVSQSGCNRPSAEMT